MKSMLIKTIKDFVENYPAKQDVETRWEIPIVRFAESDDPLFFKFSTLSSGGQFALP